MKLEDVYKKFDNKPNAHKYLCEKLDVSRVAIHKWKMQKKIPIKRAIQISKILLIDVNYSDYGL